MAVIKLGDLTTFTGDPAGSFLVINNPDNSATYKIQRELFMSSSISGQGSSGQVAYFNGTTSLTSESNLFWDATNDRLGIGTTVPTYGLEIKGTIPFAAFNTTGTFGGIRFQRSDVDRFTFNINAQNDLIVSRFNSSGVFQDNPITAYEAGNVGIRTLSILTKSSANNTSPLIVGDDIAMVTSSGQSRVQIGNTSGTSVLLLGQSSNRGLLFNWTYNATPASAYGVLETYGGNNPLFIQTVGGNVGIGTTTNSGFKLDVNGTTRIQGNLTTNLTQGSIPFIGASGLLSQDNAALFWDDTNDRLGIANTSPSYNLDISGNGRVTANSFLASSTGNVGIGTLTPTTFTNYTSMHLRGRTASGGSVLLLSTSGDEHIVRLVGDSDSLIGTYSNTPFSIFTNGSGRAKFFANGNVAIGTLTDSGFKLDINGTTRIQNTLTVSSGGALVTGLSSFT